MRRILPVLLLAAALLACGGGSSVPPIPVSLDELRLFHVKGLRFEKDFVEYRNAEIEVYVIDSTTGHAVLCAGQEHGMQVVQQPGTDYTELDATLIPIEGSRLTEVSRFKFAIYERDSRHCPNQINATNSKLLGETKELTYDQFTSGSFSLKDQKTGYLALQERTIETTPITLSEILNLRLKSLRFMSTEYGEGSRPEIEIHLVDVWTNRTLACIGPNEGLESVDEPEVDYDNLLYPFVKIRSMPETTEATWLRLLLVDRDEGACPGPFDIWKDRVLATSQVMTLADLQRGESLPLDTNVAQLEIGSLETYEPLFATLAPIEEGGLKVDRIKVLGSNNEHSLSEIEVHLIDPSTGGTFACAGEEEGLEGVEVGGLEFVNLSAALRGHLPEDRATEVTVVIVERDISQCPAPATRAHDDFLAETTVTIDDLTDGPISFENGSSITFSR
ncbi:MAG: hypothetical protein HYT77_00570 [Deltaproteobacteria bacterium]|nr:hypothetical protein [Deltaproteobacteria bacterium]